MNKNFLVLVILVGLGVAGWMNKDKLVSLYQAKFGGGGTGNPEEVVDGSTDSEPTPRARGPHPATEATAAVLKAYPALGIKGSPFNQKFVALHAEAEKSNPALLTRPDWPIKLAEQTAIALGGAPMPMPTPTPAPQSSGLMGTALDKKPDPKKH